MVAPPTGCLKHGLRDSHKGNTHNNDMWTGPRAKLNTTSIKRGRPWTSGGCCGFCCGSGGGCSNGGGGGCIWLPDARFAGFTQRKQTKFHNNNTWTGPKAKFNTTSIKRGMPWTRLPSSDINGGSGGWPASMTQFRWGSAFRRFCGGARERRSEPNSLVGDSPRSVRSRRTMTLK